MTCPYCKDGKREPPLHLERIRRMAIIRAYEQLGLNKTHAAKALGISRASLVTWLQHWGVKEKFKVRLTKRNAALLLMTSLALGAQAHAKGYDKTKDPKRTMKHWRPQQKQEPLHVNPSAKKAASLPTKTNPKRP